MTAPRGRPDPHSRKSRSASHPCPRYPATPRPGSASAGALVPLAPTPRGCRRPSAQRPPVPALVPAEGACPAGQLTCFPKVLSRSRFRGAGRRVVSRIAGEGSFRVEREALGVAGPTKGAFSKCCSTSLQNNASNIEGKYPSRNVSSVTSLS